MKVPRWLMIALIIIVVLCLLVTVWALFFGDSGTTLLTPDYAPIEKEENGEKIEGDNGAKLEAESGGGAVGITYSDKVTIDLSDKKATLYFANPGKSLQDMVLQVVIQDVIIIQSGTINPGIQVRTLNLSDGKEELLAEGIYEGKFVVHYYDAETGEKAMINTEISIVITVQE